ncbi:unnamed protein product [Clavelina lepadiformis]|uniref:Uncharacterized protein n=1 Tax=Clavelina lepadiformis TaxID=159417 RepID=A0ABP0FSM9_CLALP
MVTHSGQWIRLVASICMWIGFGFLISSQLNRAWFVQTIGNFEFELGLFSSCTSGFCTYFAWTDNDVYASYVARIFFIIADIAVGCSILLHFANFFVSDPRQIGKRLRLEGSIHIMAGSFLMGGIVAFTIIITTQFAVGQTQWALSSGYSAAWPAAILLVVAGSLMLAASPSYRSAAANATQPNNPQVNVTTVTYKTTGVSYPPQTTPLPPPYQEHAYSNVYGAQTTTTYQSPY